MTHRDPGVRSPPDPPGASLRPVALAMAAALALIAGQALVLSPEGPAPARTLVVGLAGAAIGMVVVGVVLAVTSSGGEPGPARSARILVSLALREGGGLLGAVLAFLGAGRALPAGLAGLAIVSLLSLLPPRRTAS